MEMPEKEIQEELVGVLTAISIVSKRLANRLMQFKKQETEGLTGEEEGREVHGED
jgi:hypothetical protein